MPFSGRRLISALRFGALVWVIALVTQGSAGVAQAALDSSSPLHTSADRQLWHRKENRVELFGNASVAQPGETLKADYVSLDKENRVLDAKGNCVYVSAGSVIFGDEMHFNLDTRTGTIVGGRVSNERFSLSGQRINKLGDGRFQTHHGEYTTCRDCPNSWSLLAEDVDMQIEGYAYMSGVTGQVAGIPSFWLPYLVVPMKTRRQTGLLFPSFSPAGPNGFTFVLPLFWAISPNADMTLGLGYYTKRGQRVEWEGRYALSPRSGGAANFNYLYDKSFINTVGDPLSASRWSLNVAQSQELPFGIEEKLRIQEVSDNLYPIKIADPFRNFDVVSGGELNLASSLSFSYASPDLSAYVAARRYRTLVNTNPDPTDQAKQFDPRTVQTVPNAVLTTRDRQLFGVPLVFGLSLGLTHFTRSGDAFDYDFTQVPYGVDPNASGVSAPAFSAGNLVYGGTYFPNVNPIRKATRLALTPTLYTAFRPFDILSFVPSIRYYGYFYTFPHSDNFSVSNLQRGYLLFQADLGAQLERIYEYPNDKSNPRTKHLIRPLLRYSYIPPKLVQEDLSHPFQSQIDYAAKRGIPGYYFDSFDIVPIDASPATTNYFNPLGNSLALGFTTQWIRRNGALDSTTPSYTKFVDFSAGQALNFREYQKGSANPQPLTRFFSTLDLNLQRLGYSQLYYYYPYIEGIRHTITSTLSYSLAGGLRQGLFAFDRSLTLNYTWDQHGLTDLTKGTNNLTASLNYSLSDYILPSVYASYLLVGSKWQYYGLNLQFQHPSRCWKFTVSLPYRIENGLTWNIDLALNITGTGYGGVTELATQSGVVVP